MAHETYVGIIKDPDFVYSGEPEAWRDNVELVVHLGKGGGPLAEFALMPKAQRVDWATLVLPVTYEELRAYVGPRREVDVTSYRPFMPDMSDAEIRETMNFEPRAKIERLPRDRCYALVSVEDL